MRRRFFWVPFFSLVILFTVIGCSSVYRALDNYKACAGDSECLSNMESVRENSYVVTKSAASGLPIPSMPEIIAIAVSNLLSFGYGVFHGKKKG